MPTISPLRRWALALSVAAAGCAARAPAAARPPTEAAIATPAVPSAFASLPFGPRSVGFRQEMRVDPTRRYGWESRRDADTRRAPRPVLVNVWYPAAPSSLPPMTAADYLRVPGHPDLEPTFAERLSRHARRILLDETVGAAAAPAAIARMLRQPMAARRDAPAAAGAFPLVLYHSGLGGGFEDSAVLCELLASHGYVVVSSAYEPEQELSLYIDWDIERSLADLQFLLAALRGQPGIDWTRIAVMGHSYGAQAALAFALRNGVADAVISLDSTLENMPPETLAKASLAYHFGDGDRLRAPALIFSSDAATSRTVLESLQWSDRTYVRVADMDHNDFISHGGALTRGVLPGYAAVCRAVLAFLDARLKGAATAIVASPGITVEHLAAEPGFAGSDDVVRAVLAGGDELERVCRATQCSSWRIADAAKYLVESGQVDAGSQLLDRAAPLVRPSFRLEQERGRVEGARGHRDAARGHLVEAKRMLEAETGLEPRSKDILRAMINMDLRAIDGPS